MKLILTMLTSVAILLMFLAAIDREVARQDYLTQRVKVFPSTIKGCIFASNCRHYNDLLRGVIK